MILGKFHMQISSLLCAAHVNFLKQSRVAEDGLFSMRLECLINAKRLMNGNFGHCWAFVENSPINHHQVALIGGEARLTMHLAYDVLLCPATFERFITLC